MRNCSPKAVFTRSCIICTDKDINNTPTSVVNKLVFHILVVMHPEKLSMAVSVGIYITVSYIVLLKSEVAATKA